jgi:hypothetical protein
MTEEIREKLGRHFGLTQQQCSAVNTFYQYGSLMLKFRNHTNLSVIWLKLDYIQHSQLKYNGSTIGHQIHSHILTFDNTLKITWQWADVDFSEEHQGSWMIQTTIIPTLKVCLPCTWLSLLMPEKVSQNTAQEYLTDVQCHEFIEKGSSARVYKVGISHTKSVLSIDRVYGTLLQLLWSLSLVQMSWKLRCPY